FVFTLERDKLIVFFEENVVTEFREECRELLIDFGQSRLCRSRELRAGTDEIRVVEPSKSLRFGVELLLLRRVVNGLDALEALFVLRDLSVERGELRAPFALHRFKFSIRHHRTPN